MNNIYLGQCLVPPQYPYYTTVCYHLNSPHTSCSVLCFRHCELWNFKMEDYSKFRRLNILMKIPILHNINPFISTTLLRQELPMKCKWTLMKYIKHSLPGFLKPGPSFLEAINILPVINSNGWSNPSVQKN